MYAASVELGVRGSRGGLTGLRSPVVPKQPGEDLKMAKAFIDNKLGGRTCRISTALLYDHVCGLGRIDTCSKPAVSSAVTFVSQRTGIHMRIRQVKLVTGR